MNPKAALASRSITAAWERLNAAARRTWQGEVMRGISASWLGLGVLLLIQLCSIPLFLLTVGTREYGYWLIITAVPSYLSLSDLGFAAASATAATQALASKRSDRARQILASAWAGVSTISILFLLVLALAGWMFLSPEHFPGLGSSARVIFLLQLAWVLCWMQIGFAEAAFRSSGQYARGITYLNMLRVTEFAFVALSLLLGAGLVWAAATMLFVRTFGGTLIHVSAKRRMSWFRLSPRWVDIVTIRRLSLPSITYSAFSVGAALQNEGMVLLVAARLNPATVVVFSTVRSMTNALAQLTGVTVGGALPALTRALAVGDVIKEARIQRQLFILTMFLDVLLGVILVFEGRSIVVVWTAHRINTSFLFLTLMVATTVADAPWQISTNLLRATNKHQLVGPAYFFSCGLSVGIAYFLTPVLGLSAIPTALFSLDLIITPIAFREVRAKVLSQGKLSGKRLVWLPDQNVAG